MSSLVIKEKNNGQRLDVFLSKQFLDISRSQWQRKIKAGEVLVNNKEKGVSYRVKVGDELQFSIFNSQFLNNDKILKLKNEKQKTDIKNFKKIDVIFEDDNYVVVDKPAGMVVHPDNKHKGDTLVDWLLVEYPYIEGVGGQVERPGIVHRLDKDVSGLMVIALNQKTFEHLKKEFQAHRVEKEYRALVHGRLQVEGGEIKTPIKRSKTSGLFVADSTFDSVSRSALTYYEVLERYRNFTLLKVKILTGRTHQIRVHLNSIGHSIVGDKLYLTHDVRMKKKSIDLGRLWLYAARLAFNDLRYNWQEFKVDTPSELKLFLNKLK